MSQDALRRLRRRTLLGAATGGAAACLLAGAVFGRSQALGVGLGVVTSGLTFHLHGADARVIAGLTPGAARRRARVTSLGRTAIRASALAVAYVRPELSFPWAVAGLFAVPAVLALESLSGPAADP